jgi:predicted ATPase
MRLKSIRLVNFCNFSDATLELGDVTVIVGKNDVGKSNILKAIDILLNQSDSTQWDEIISRGGGYSPGSGSTRSDDHRYFRDFNSENMKLQGIISFSESEFEEIIPDDEFEVSEQRKKKYRREELSREVSFDMSFWAEAGEIKWIVQDMQIHEGPMIYRGGKDPVGLTRTGDGIYALDPKAEITVKIFNMIRGSFQLVRGDRTLQRISSPSEYEGYPHRYFAEGRNIVEDIFWFEKDVTLKKSSIFQELNEDIVRLFPKYGKVASMAEGEEWKSVYYDNMPSSSVGEGVKQLTVLSFNLRKSTSPIAAIEEPEIHLHPEMQRKALDLLEEESAERQIIITTHSPTIAGNVDIGALKIVKELEDGTSTIESVDEDNIGLLAQELGVNVRDIFEPEGIVFVEGLDDAAYMKAFWEKVASSKKIRTRVRFVECGGWPNMRYYSETRILRDLGRPFCLLFDGDTDKSEEARNMKKRMVEASGVPKKAVFTLPAENVEHYLMVPEAINRAFPGISLATAREATEKYSKKRDKKTVLSHLFEIELRLPFNRAKGVEIAEKMKAAEVDATLVEVFQKISKIFKE